VDSAVTRYEQQTPSASTRTRRLPWWSVKLCFNDKKTGWHVDVTQDKATGKAKPNNSQMPNTPVAIVSFGDAKVLEFMKRYSKNNKVVPEEVLCFFPNNWNGGNVGPTG